MLGNITLLTAEENHGYIIHTKHKACLNFDDYHWIQVLLRGVKVNQEDKKTKKVFQSHLILKKKDAVLLKVKGKHITQR